MNSPRHLVKTQGFTLIEVLIAILILGTSLLAISAMQIRSLEQNRGSYTRSQANILAYDIMDRVRVLNYELPGTVATLSDGEVANLISASLPNGTGSVDCDGRVCTVSLTWDESRGTDADGATTTFTYTTRL